MFKKVVLILLVAILVFFNFYQIYKIKNNNNYIYSLEENIKAYDNENEFLSLYKELEDEIGDVSAISDKIGLLKREYRDNEEALEISIQDLERIKQLNSEVEKDIIYYENLKKKKNNIR